ncbi:pyridoxamine 5'-phosphate oxidase family protein [Alkaliphilus crotonatoxidans]
MRKESREIATEAAKEILYSGEVGVLSTVDEAGQPYGVPVNYASDHEYIYFHCALEGHKLDNIKGNNRVCFTVYGSNQVIPDRFTSTYESVVVFGTAEEITGDRKIRALELLVEKYSPGFITAGKQYIERAHDKTCVLAIKMEHITGKRSMKQG